MAALQKILRKSYEIDTLLTTSSFFPTSSQLSTSNPSVSFPLFRHHCYSKRMAIRIDTGLLIHGAFPARDLDLLVFNRLSLQPSIFLSYPDVFNRYILLSPSPWEAKLCPSVCLASVAGVLLQHNRGLIISQDGPPPNRKCAPGHLLLTRSHWPAQTQALNSSWLLHALLEGLGLQPTVYPVPFFSYPQHRPAFKVSPWWSNVSLHSQFQQR